MTTRRLFLIRHGETDGDSSVRFHGRNDVPLSPAGRMQMRRVHWKLRDQVIDAWVASTLRRSWEGARIASGGARVRLDPDLREVDFGRWEGLTRDEIEAQDPEAHARWQQATPERGFDFPGGETAAAFRARVSGATDRMLASGDPCAAAVLHKGVIRQMLRHLGIADPGPSRPALAEVLRLGRLEETWRLL